MFIGLVFLIVGIVYLCCMVLVTGATGLVGSHLLLHLLKNGAIEIRAMYRDELKLAQTRALFVQQDKLVLFDKVEWVRADILDIPSLEGAFEGVDFVYHCAGFISFDPKDELLLRKINIEGTANIVNFCIDKKVIKLCHVSSIAALGDLEPNEWLLNEATKWNSEKLHSDYAISKYGAEMEVWRGQQEGLSVVIVNPGVILGEGFWGQGSSVLFDRVWDGITFYTEGVTGYVSVLDVVQIMHTLMESTVNGERMVVVSEQLSYKDILSKIAVKMGLEPPKRKVASWLLQCAWRIDWFLSLFGKKRFLSRQSAASLVNIEELSNEKSLTFLEYESIDNCLDRVVPIYLKEKR